MVWAAFHPVLLEMSKLMELQMQKYSQRTITEDYFI